MADRWRVFGKNHNLAVQSEGGLQWSFEERPGGWIIARGVDASGVSVTRRLMASQSQLRLSASLSGVLFGGEIQKAQRGGVDSASDADLVAQFPGKVRKILVSVGDSVVKGQPLILVEAMKMEFSIKAPRDGRVKKLGVQDQQQVAPGTVFVELDAADQKAAEKKA